MPSPNKSPYPPLNDQEIAYWKEARNHAHGALAKEHLSDVDVRSYQAVVDAANRYLPPEEVVEVPKQPEK